MDVITIDGPAGSGKSTVSRILAKKIKYTYLDTGAMYRAVALDVKRKEMDLNNGKMLGDHCKALNFYFDTHKDPPILFMDGKDISLLIRSPEMDMLSSKVSAVNEVREAMVDLQHKIAEGRRIVAEGRDMGTIVFPDAKHKFFLTASPEIRAERRYRERLLKGESISKVIVASEMKKRDLQDETRANAPLKPAKNAKIIDSTTLTVEEVIEEILDRLKEK
ncbi:MAG: (d)CMP kinase [Desulfobacterales bacterium]|nr:(d)CMP kinase [Desulfobacterales bacterium]